ncbi:fatty acyl-CoA reductase [Trichonephila clavipes]|nr:fatty acyl-CoA reductase [Trichonephila clavipes]
MITNFFIPELNNHDVQELWFQQDGATCHTARATMDLLKDTFGDRLISRFGPVNWPPRSCDLTPLDYFLWGYVKSLVYADKPQTLDHLEDNIRRVIADIRPQMLEKVIKNWTFRLDYIRGSPMPEIIFKMTLLKINVLGVYRVAQVCLKMTKLQALVHVSTAYSFCHNPLITEDMHCEKIPIHIMLDFDSMSDERIEHICDSYRKSRPSNYQYSKALGETLLVQGFSDRIPVIIVRPGIITAAAKEPFPVRIFCSVNIAILS